jgi:hypothetical protein
MESDAISCEASILGGFGTSHQWPVDSEGVSDEPLNNKPLNNKPLITKGRRING